MARSSNGPASRTHAHITRRSPREASGQAHSQGLVPFSARRSAQSRLMCPLKVGASAASRFAAYRHSTFNPPQLIASVGTDCPANGLYCTVAQVVGSSFTSMIHSWICASSVVPQ